MRMYDIIEKKRDGLILSEDEIRYFISGYTNGTIPDYQVSALLMAIYFQGMNQTELAYLTKAMVDSGDTIDLSAIEGVKVDKHSTGGVGDTTTLILAPLVASLGVPVAKMSGRGLGHTGGTLDKLESIPGFHIEITRDEFIQRVNQNKVAVIGQTGNLTPADKKIYSLRDVTATVNSIPLIASSIMSKKIAAGSDAIVLDVKTGQGAFMKQASEAEELAKSMVAIGNKTNRKTIAVISDMNQPLGYAVGNALEVKEAIETLQGNGPKDLTELCLTLGTYMVVLSGVVQTEKEARKKLEENLQNGKALQTFKLFIESQGGDPQVVDDPDRLPQAKYKIEVPAKKSGTVSKIIADDIGTIAMSLGAGRQTKDDVIDLAVGIVLHKKIGESVKAGETLVTIHSNHEDISDIKPKIYESILISGDNVTSPRLIHNIIS
ncbi:pyrimidine-nucleoside phosphorylase [Cerasibacillus quisquiliarum]|uniref:Pyrimidine-nucleoside phosphorylase n=1 Tax=Cerasibacillus quisquiliarum TaxID=227865 RepID=A0A511V3N6_9BACI|nr:pyrimidine-nucleoside phosphorylase [Cerasibacillus quisquiliarum]MBB5145428.1 pyrimidine-nucleoside phosphorylase [Cerasibacillus quisquiliarum]GEN31862.1 pyrimidine-nucleoside phosphorylase [Cerasibacillus quisquiliarum]